MDRGGKALARLSAPALALALAFVPAACGSAAHLALVQEGAGSGSAGGPPARPAFAEPPGPIRHVILVTVDGLTPESYLNPDVHGLRIPTLRRMVQQGAFSDGARSVFPSVTYPAHSSSATGGSPARHGLYSNYAEDPQETNPDGWRWYAEDLRAPPIWEAARRAGYQTALINWP